MNNKFEAKSFEDAQLCAWCGIPLGSANLVRQSVCVRCYKLLMNANLSDEEIFGTKDRKKESSLSHINIEGKK